MESSERDTPETVLQSWPSYVTKYTPRWIPIYILRTLDSMTEATLAVGVWILLTCDNQVGTRFVDFARPANTKKQDLLRSYPNSVLRFIPEWTPYCILWVMDWIAKFVLPLLILIYFTWLSTFSSTDIWGARRDRAAEKRNARFWKQYKKEEEYWRPKPLKLKRRRRLSLPLEEKKVKKASWWQWKWKREEIPQQSFDRLQSPLGRLPEELRFLIYYHLVGGNRLHVQESYQRFGFVECTSDNGRLDTTETCSQLLPCLVPHLTVSTTRRHHERKGIGSRICLSSYDKLLIKPVLTYQHEYIPSHETLSLAKACRLFYTGYISALYSLTTFTFTSLKQFQTFSTTILPHRLDMMTNLHFYSELGSSFRDRLDVGWEEVDKSQWKPAWEIIATMQQLKVLIVDLRMERFRADPRSPSYGVQVWMEERIFGPMKLPRQVSVFNVTANWAQNDGFVLGEVPFKLDRVLENIAWSELLAAQHTRQISL